MHRWQQAYGVFELIFLLYLEMIMKKKYFKPEADKISFNYRDQVVAASSGGDNGNSNGWIENSLGFGAAACGSGGLVDYLFDFIYGICE